MTALQKTKKIFSLFLLSFLLVGCSTIDGIVPERYQLWADDGTDAASPNLSSIPNADEIQAARERAETLRSQLESDRERARRVAMGLPVERSMPGRSLYGASENTVPSHTQDLTESQAAMWQRLQATNAGRSPGYDGTMPMAPNPSVTVNEPVSFAPSATDYYMPDNIIVNYDAIPDANYMQSNNPVSYGADVQYRYFNHGNGYTQPQEVMSNGTSYMGGSFLGHGSYVYASADNVGIQSDAYGTPVMPLASGLAGMIFYDHGSAKLSHNDKEFLGQMASQLQDSFQPVRIIGHASPDVETNDPVMGAKLNLTMSLKRATNVMKQLHKDGVPYTNMSVFAHGSSTPMWDVEGKSKEEAARRVEIYVD